MWFLRLHRHVRRTDKIVAGMKKAAPWLAFAVWILVVVEVTSFGLKVAFYPDGPQQLQANAAAQSQQTFEKRVAQTSPDTMLIHPYLGFALTPYNTHAGKESLETYGYGPNAGPVIREKIDNVLVVGILGGSVAKQFVESGYATEMARMLKDSPKYANKGFIVTAPTNNGYKQPQQLLSLTYMLAQGAHFDIVIALDGFNEVALAETHAKAGLATEYPWSWHGRVQPLELDSVLRLAVGEIAVTRRELAASTQNARKCWSYTYSLFETVRAERLIAQLAQQENEVVGLRDTSDIPFFVRGPLPPAADDPAMYEAVVKMWKNSSLQINALAKSNGFKYYHFLQPNQYDVGSKPMDPEERANIYFETHIFRSGPEVAYPLMRKAGKELAAEGENFHDLSGLFKNVEEDTYSDNCCHMNQRGNEMLAKAIAQAILAQ